MSDTRQEGDENDEKKEMVGSGPNSGTIVQVQILTY